MRLPKSFGGARCSVLPYDMTAGYSAGSDGCLGRKGGGNYSRKYISVPKNAEDRETAIITLYTIMPFFIAAALWLLLQV